MIDSNRPIVAKAGTDVFLEEGRLSPERIGSLVEQIAHVKDVTRLRAFFLVVSGAIAAGLAAYGRKRPSRELTVPEKQKYASAGTELYEHFRVALKRHKLVMNLVQVTRQNFRDVLERANMLQGIASILTDEQDSLIVINENDMVATEELRHRFGDNDKLAEKVTLLVGAERHIILGTTNGILRDINDPKSTIQTYTADCDRFIRNDIRSENGGGTSGADIKVTVGKNLAAQGVATDIANGRQEGMLSHILLDGSKDENWDWTTFLPQI